MLEKFYLKINGKKLAKKIAFKANNKCEICGKFTLNLDCHEVWEYKNNIQKLIDLVALCKRCQEVKHFGLAEIKGRRQQALKHLIKINNISEKEAEQHIKSEFDLWEKRSQQNWKLDISFLNKFDI